jgi:hypothetical protein
MPASRWPAIPEQLAWIGPVALAAYYLWLFPPTIWAGIRGDALWVALAVVGVIGLFVGRLVMQARGGQVVLIRPTELMAIEVLAAALVDDAENSTANGLRDLHLYLNAGMQFVAGAQVYTPQPIDRYPSDLGFLPFLYPPVTLPFFGGLSQLPPVLTDAGWLLGSLAVVIASLRLLGLSWPWTIAALAWTPIEQGLFVGNIAVPSFFLLAVAIRVPVALVFGPLAKPQNAIPALWLVRERRWRPIAVGVALVLAAIVVTLPMTGPGRWAEWVDGLFTYQESQRLLPGLYGIGLGRYLPGWLYAAIVVVVIVLALVPRGREGLARTSLASVVASPSLWSHGYLMAIPAFLRMRSFWLWICAGLLCAGAFPGPQLALAIAVAGWLVPAMRRDLERPDHGPHPLGEAAEPWPGPTGGSRPGAA